MEVHRMIVSLVDIILFIVAGIVLVIAALTQSAMLIIAAIVGICFTLSVWSALRLIVDNTDKTRIASQQLLQALKNQQSAE